MVEDEPSGPTEEKAEEVGPIASAAQQEGQPDAQILTTGTTPEAVAQPVKEDEEPPEPPAELSQDIQAKLKKLGKLESKYSELLKAYRKAHARNAAIEPFEACLRETTPLTTIFEPDAFADYLKQLTTKGDMVMGELKRVSADNDGLRRNLDVANKAKESVELELSQLKAQQADKEAEIPNKGEEPPVAVDVAVKGVDVSPDADVKDGELTNESLKMGELEKYD